MEKKSDLRLAGLFADALRQQHQMIVVHPDQVVFFENAGNGAAERAIALLISRPAFGGKIHPRRKVMEERPDGLVWIPFVKCLRGAGLQLGRFVAIAIARVFEELFPLGGVNRSVVARPANPKAAHLLQDGQHCRGKSSRTRLRAPVLALAGKRNRQAIAHHEESVLASVVGDIVRRPFGGGDPRFIKPWFSKGSHCRGMSTPGASGIAYATSHFGKIYTVRGDLRIPILVLLLSPAMLSQDAPASRETGALVTVPCVVTDERGQTINELNMNDFRLYVDGTPRQIDSLWLQGESPLLLGVIEDVSETQKNRIAQNDVAIAQLLQKVVHKLNRAFVLTVNDNVILKAEVTHGPNGLRNKSLPPGGEPLGVPCGAPDGAHGRKRPACGGTALWDAVYAAAHYKLNGSGENKALLILSAGNDTGSTHSFTSALEEVKRSGTVVYAIQYADDLGVNSRINEMTRLTRETGGLYFHVRVKDFSPMISRIAADIRGRYVIGFRPTAADNDIGRLKVEVMRPGASVRAGPEFSIP